MEIHPTPKGNEMECEMKSSGKEGLIRKGGLLWLPKPYWVKEQNKK